MASTYGSLKVPKFTPYDAGKGQGDYFDMITGTSGKAADATRKINEINQAELTHALETALGPDYASTWGEGRETLRRRARMEMSAGEEEYFRNLYAGQAQNLGIQGAGASANLTVSGMGRTMMEMQSRALQQLPGYLGAEKQALTATPTRVESMFIPIQQYASQQAADNINVWRQQYAVQQAAHQSEMANTAYRLQQEQAAKVEAQSIDRQGAATRNAVAMQNQAAYASGSQRSWGISGGPAPRGRRGSRVGVSAFDPRYRA
jgi:hypothetical protein